MWKRLSDDATEGVSLLASKTSTNPLRNLRSTPDQEPEMAATITVEEEHGTYTRTPRHPHNGYYAGDFRQYPADRPVPPPAAHAPWS